MSEQWYYIAQAQQRGPMSLEQLLDLATTGRLGPNTPLWKAGMRLRKPARSTPEMSAAHFAEPPAIRTSLCLGEPILAAIGMLAEPSVAVTGLAALGFLALLLMR